MSYPPSPAACNQRILNVDEEDKRLYILSKSYKDERILHRSHKQLKRMYSRRKNFFTNITYEFRPPLTIILGVNQDLQQEESEQIRERTKSIERQDYIPSWNF